MDGLAVIEGDSMLHYTACGLDYVWLANGFEHRDTPHGRLTRIHNLDGLHNAIAKWIVTNPARLRGREVRFLRSMLGLSQEGLGKAIGLGQSRATIARWESEADKPIPKASDNWLRVVYARKAEGDREVCKLVDLLIELDELQNGRAGSRVATFRDENVRWASSAATTVVG
jgi:DNA-binding transcriptional regulator YiaG